MKTITKTALKKMNTLALIGEAVEHTSSTGQIAITPEARPYVQAIAERLGLEPLQTLFLSVLVDQSDDSRIQARDIARHFGCRTIAVLSHEDDIDALVRRRAIARRKDNDGDITYRVPGSTIEALRQGHLPERENYDNLTAQGWLNAVESLLHQRGRDEISDADLYDTLREILNKNQHLHLARQIRSFHLDDDDLVLFLAMSMCYINDHDDRIMQGDIDDYFSHSTWRTHCRCLERGNHILMQANLVEHACVDGQVQSAQWCLTAYAKEDIYAELSLRQPTDVRANLTRHEDIREKRLFYTPAVERQVSQLRSLLEPEKMKRIVERLAENGMRRGFACIFYGGPGTGKTETVLQLARQTHRDVMLVDIPSIRSKWVGEQEKNIKALFDRYRRAVQSSRDGNAPILLFNEADALLGRRDENGLSPAAKEENSMQNIILQEMENLEGIMIATTNLSASLDEAFERRFLYKVEFDKPTPRERRHIWQSMLPDLSEADALTLAERFDFSGGQIENITRKRLISDILDERDTLDIAAIIDSCSHELLGKKRVKAAIGF